MTTVSAEVRRPLGYDSFGALLPGVDVLRIASDGVTFDADLTPEQIDAVRCYITARNDADQAARANLADLLASDTTASPLAQALARYLLGDT